MAVRAAWPLLLMESVIYIIMSNIFNENNA